MKKFPKVLSEFVIICTPLNSVHNKYDSAGHKHNSACNKHESAGHKCKSVCNKYESVGHKHVTLHVIRLEL